MRFIRTALILMLLCVAVSSCKRFKYEQAKAPAPQPGDVPEYTLTPSINPPAPAMTPH